MLATFQRGEKQVPSWVGPVLPEAIANQQEIADVFYQAGVLTKPVHAKSTYSSQLNTALATAETSYRQKYTAWFVTPAWAT